MWTKAHLAALLVTIAAAAGSVACAADGTAPSPAPSPAPAPEDKALTVTVTEGKISGTYTHEADTVSFEASSVGSDVYSVTIKTRGVTLDATVDRAKGASSMDGFATDNGLDTQLTKEDLPVLKAFDKAIEGRFSSAKNDKVADTLTRMASVWSDWPSTLTLSRRVLAEENRSYTMLCGYIGTTYDTTHDCCTHWYDPCSSHSDWSSGSSVHSYIGDWGGGSTDYADGTTGWQWTTGSFDHHGWPYEYNDCFARCGADCGSGTQYTVDCGNHDNCVRNGHWIGSPYCDDEFSSTLDDAISAPNCY